MFTQKELLEEEHAFAIVMPLKNDVFGNWTKQKNVWGLYVA